MTPKKKRAPPKRGQVWSLAMSSGGRQEVTIAAVTPKVVRVRLGMGVILTISRRTIDRRLRGARLERLSNGRVVSEKPVFKHAETEAERTTASALVKRIPPRAMTEEEKVLYLHESEGLSLTTIATRMGKSRSAVTDRLKKARAAAAQACP